MSTVGLITEYNPFHLGHKYHIDEAKRITGADNVIVVMSGNYVQRGEPSFVDKYTKTKITLNNGADMVIELPCCFACSSAEYFSYAAVTILDRLGMVDFLCFGAETCDLDVLSHIADILSDEPDMYRTLLNKELKKGVPFARAREAALSAYTGCDMHDILSAPNNILAIEYLKALFRRRSLIKPVAIKRIVADYHNQYQYQYHDIDIDYDKRFYSASAIRSLAECCYGELSDSLNKIDVNYSRSFEKNFPIFFDDYSKLLGYSLHTHIFDDTLSNIFGMTIPLSNRIIKSIEAYKSASQFADMLKTKDISYSAVSRALLHCVLNIFNDDINEYIDNDICSFFRILGFSEGKSELFKLIKAHSDMKPVTSVAECQNDTKINAADKKLLKSSIYCDNLYRMLCMQKYNSKPPTEYTAFIQKL